MTRSPTAYASLFDAVTTPRPAARTTSPIGIAGR